MDKATAEAIASIRRWKDRPSTMVREMFSVEPDIWQEEALDVFPHKLRLAMKACKGPGKTAVLAWLGWNFMLTRPHARVGATSISGDNLKAGLWTELALWYNRSPLLKSAFEMTKSEIFARDHPETWKMEARTWRQDATPEQLGQALAGLHSKYVMWLLDESGGYPLALLPTVEAIFSGNPVEAHVVQAGNPTSLEGPLYQACVRARDLWYVVEITGDPDNPKRSPRIPVEHARQQIAQFGRESPWVKINIFGEFPSASLNSLIGEEEIIAATRRSYRPEDIAKAARVLGVDVARFGDDASVCWPRQGLVAFKPMRWRGLNSVEGGAAVARKANEWGADAIFVDDTGGYGAGWIDHMRLLGKAPIGIGFASSASDPRYYNKRTEMYFDAVNWIMQGGQLPPMDTPGMAELTAALSRTTYTFKGDRMLLEPKEMVKERLGYSPDDADSFCLTHAQPVIARARESGRPMHVAEYDPFAEFAKGMQPMVRHVARHSYEYDPFA